MLLASPVAAQQHDPSAPCGRDENGVPYDCRRIPMLEATCQTSADPRYCVPYHQIACQVHGFAAACRLWQMGAQCYGGDPAVCAHYIGLLAANRDCTLGGHAPACQYLAAQGF
ncbi:MAG: hypothetical protein ACK4OP_14580 [Gemmobacter sp.]